MLSLGDTDQGRAAHNNPDIGHNHQELTSAFNNLPTRYRKCKNGSLLSWFVGIKLVHQTQFVKCNLHHNERRPEDEGLPYGFLPGTIVNPNSYERSQSGMDANPCDQRPHPLTDQEG